MSTEPHNHEALRLLESIADKIRANPQASEILVIAKIGDEFHRVSSGMADIMQLIAVLELTKFDALRRMEIQ